MQMCWGKNSLRKTNQIPQIQGHKQKFSGATRKGVTGQSHSLH